MNCLKLCIFERFVDIFDGRKAFWDQPVMNTGINKTKWIWIYDREKNFFQDLWAELAVKNIFTLISFYFLVELLRHSFIFRNQTPDKKRWNESCPTTWYFDPKMIKKEFLQYDSSSEISPWRWRLRNMYALTQSVRQL